jgi:hypothetical protein
MPNSGEDLEAMLNETFNAFINQLQTTIDVCPSPTPLARIAQKFCINTELKTTPARSTSRFRRAAGVLGGSSQ